MKLKKATNSLSYVKSHPEIFLTYNDVRMHDLATKIVTDIVTLNCFPAMINVVDNWWLVMSSSDWMSIGLSDTTQDVFTQLIPNPKAGQNESRSEIVLNAFASNIFISKKGNIKLIKGELEDRIVNDVKERYGDYYLMAFNQQLNQ